MHDPDTRELRARLPDPTLIPTISSYCDRRCERCRFRERCGAYRLAGSWNDPAVQDERAVPDNTGAGAVIRSLRQTVGMLRQLAETYGLAQDILDEDREKAERYEQALEDKTMSDATVQSAKQYFLITMPIIRGLRPLIQARADEAASEAVDTIEAVAHLVASKVFRAVSAIHEDGHDPDDIQSDANGSAKIARILIAESRAAWKVLMEVGRATADGVPAQLVRRLEAIDAGIIEHLPRAMEFIRPGFDELEGQRVPAGDLEAEVIGSGKR